MYFKLILRGFIAQIEYSHPRKVPQKDTPNALFRFPKSSFGRHKNEKKNKALRFAIAWSPNEYFERRAIIRERIFKALLEYLSTRFGRRLSKLNTELPTNGLVIEKLFENTHRKFLLGCIKLPTYLRMKKITLIVRYGCG